jgi:hypothetical protein
METKKQPAANAPEIITTYKAFDSNLRCRGFQYDIGKTYDHGGSVEACISGFHACEFPLDVLRYYPPAGSRFAAVEQSGKLARHSEDTKIASSRISIMAEVNLAGLVSASVDWVKKKVSATSGNYAHSATSGDYANSATSGNYANSATSGDCANSATSGNYANSATSGNYAHSATSGKYAHSATSGNYAHSATSGDCAHSATSGNYAHSATSGDCAHSATSGDYANSATSGYGAKSSAAGKHAVAANAGNGPAMAGEGSAIFIVERGEDNQILAVFASKVGENGIKAGSWYSLRGGKPVEVA